MSYVAVLIMSKHYERHEKYSNHQEVGRIKMMRKMMMRLMLMRRRKRRRI